MQRIKKYRTLKKEYRDLLFAAERTAHSIEEDAQSEKNEHLKKSIQAIITSHEFAESEHDSASHIGKLRSNFIESVHAYEHLERMLISADDAHESAKIEYMTPQKQYDALKGQLARAAEKMNLAKVQMEALAEAVKKDQNDTGRYKITAAEKGKDRPSIIAEAVAGNAYYASLVATMQNDNSALKTWTLMSEAAKEEETNKKMYRDL